MPYIDLVRAKQELMSGKEPYTFGLTGGERHTFPAALPAAVEMEQALCQREQKKRGLDSMPADLMERQVRVAYGPAEYDRLLDAGVPDTELIFAFGLVMTEWLQGYSDPNLPRRIMEWARASAAAQTTDTGSSTTGEHSKPTSNGSTDLMLGGRSTVADLVPGAFGRSSKTSPGTP